MNLEIWTAGVGIPGYTVRQARQAEAEGWDGLGLVDSQNLAGDPFVELAVAAQVTERIGLATAVTNPLTRHPAAMATAAATVQGESGGRMVVGIGRGDSSLAHLGMAPAPVALFARYLERLQGYLRGEDVPFDVAGDGGGEIASADALGMAGRPAASRVRWIAHLPKVPVDVAATGPKVIAAGAVIAERLTLAVGADPTRVAWGIDVANKARQQAGVVAADPGIGAYLPIACLPDRAAARRLVSGGVASFARFSVMHGQVTGPASDEQRSVLTAVHQRYDMGAHFQDGSPQSSALTDDVIDAFGVAGPPSLCVERLQQLAELGITRLFLLGPGFGADRDAAKESRRLLAEQVLPALR